MLRTKKYCGKFCIGISSKKAYKRLTSSICFVWAFFYIIGPLLVCFDFSYAFMGFHCLLFCFNFYCLFVFFKDRAGEREKNSFVLRKVGRNWEELGGET